MIKDSSSGQILGATIEGYDLTRPFSGEAFDFVPHSLGEYSVIRFPQQQLSARQLADFSARFGKLEVNVANA